VQAVAGMRRLGRFPLFLVVALSLLAGCFDDGPPIEEPERTGPFCGGLAGVLCADETLFCLGSEPCDTPDASGTCEPPPASCPSTFAPVCSCTGEVYQNECVARRERVTPQPCR
jgi:hypothetical protein